MKKFISSFKSQVSKLAALPDGACHPDSLRGGAHARHGSEHSDSRSLRGFYALAVPPPAPRLYQTVIYSSARAAELR